MNFDPLIQDQKLVITDPHLDLYLHDNDRELSKADFVGYNMEFVDASLPQVRNANLLHKLVKRTKHKNEVLISRSKLEQERLAKVHLDVERKLPGAKELQRKLRARELGLDIEIRHVIAGMQAINYY